MKCSYCYFLVVVALFVCLFFASLLCGKRQGNQLNFVLHVRYDFSRPVETNNILEFSDLVALKKKLPNTSFVPLFTSNCYINSNRDLRVYRIGTHLLMTNPLENNIL